MTDPEIQQVIEYYDRIGRGMLPTMSKERAAALLRESGARDAQEYIQQHQAHINAVAAEFESLPKIPRGHRLGDNASFGGWPPSGGQ